jgi:hypothetical protein
MHPSYICRSCSDFKWKARHKWFHFRRPCVNHVLFWETLTEQRSKIVIYVKKCLRSLWFGNIYYNAPEKPNMTGKQGYHTRISYKNIYQHNVNIQIMLGWNRIDIIYIVYLWAPWKFIQNIFKKSNFEERINKEKAINYLLWKVRTMKT